MIEWGGTPNVWVLHSLVNGVGTNRDDGSGFV